MKNKILQAKFIPVLLIFLIIVASVGANEIIRLNQANKYLKQARDLIVSEKPQEALKVLQQAKKKTSVTLFAKVSKNKEIKQIEKEVEKIKQLVDEKTKKETKQKEKDVEKIKQSWSRLPPHLRDFAKLSERYAPPGTKRVYLNRIAVSAYAYEQFRMSVTNAWASRGITWP